MSDQQTKVDAYTASRNEAAAAANQLLADAQIAVLRRLIEMEDLHLPLNTAFNLRKIVEAFPDGIALSKLQHVFADQVALNKARKKLKEEEQIDENDSKRSIVLKLKTPPPNYKRQEPIKNAPASPAPNPSQPPKQASGEIQPPDEPD